MLMQFFKDLRAFFKDESGASAVEYGLIVGLIAVALIAVLLLVGGDQGVIWSFDNTVLKRSFFGSDATVSLSRPTDTLSSSFWIASTASRRLSPALTLDSKTCSATSSFVWVRVSVARSLRRAWSSCRRPCCADRGS